jgi:hypothetical protein
MHLTAAMLEDWQNNWTKIPILCRELILK